jgi:hypothetical protein
LSSDGRHRTDEDDRSWHLLFLNKLNQISSCAWYLPHGDSASFERLRVRHSPLTESSAWRDRVAAAVRSELASAKTQGLAYVEVGGWAVARDSRCKSEGLLLALGAYSLGRKLGGSLGITTATVRHASSHILRRLGGLPLDADGTSIPPYFDPKYDCTMELLRFDSRRPNPKYSSLIERLRDKLTHVPVIATAVSGSAPSYDLVEDCAFEPAVA